MTIKQVKALKDFRYGTRMMRAGDVLDMDASHMRLFTALGAVGPLERAAAKHAVPAMSTEDATAPAKQKAKRTKKRATAKK